MTVKELHEALERLMIELNKGGNKRIVANCSFVADDEQYDNFILYQLDNIRFMPDTGVELMFKEHSPNAKYKFECIQCGHKFIHDRDELCECPVCGEGNYCHDVEDKA